MNKQYVLGIGGTLAALTFGYLFGIAGVVIALAAYLGVKYLIATPVDREEAERKRMEGRT